MKEMKMTRNYCYGDIITILYKMMWGEGEEGGGADIIFFNGSNLRIQIEHQVGHIEI